MLSSRRLLALAKGLGAGVMTFVALGWVGKTVVVLVVGAVHAEWLSSQGSAPRWFDGLTVGLGILGLLLSCYVGWRTGRAALRSEPRRGDVGQFFLAVQGILVVGVVAFVVAAFVFHVPFSIAFFGILGPIVLALVVGAAVAGVRARPGPTTRRDWLEAIAGVALMVVLLGLGAVGILTGHPALTIIGFCVVFVALIVGGVVLYAVKTRRETQHQDHRQ